MNLRKHYHNRSSWQAPAALERFTRAGLAGLLVQDRRGTVLQTGRERLVNFASSDYLGLSSHPLVIAAACAAAQQWGVSLGMPDVLAAPHLSRALETRFARLTGQEQALLLSSTTHIALDLLPLLAGSEAVILLDEWAYPISVDGARAAQQRGARLVRFAHNDPADLERKLRASAGAQRKIIVVDGVYPAGSSRAPLARFAQIAGQHGALIYVDDAHGTGILGTRPQGHPPYGRGGGGTPLFYGVRGGIIHTASLSKAFGVPLALAAGPSSLIEDLRQRSEARVHSSPPAVPVIAAALAALRLNERIGDSLRRRLALRTAQFVRESARAGIPLRTSGCFPILSLDYPTARAAFAAGAGLRKKGILPVVNLHPPDHPSGGVVRFIITTQHSQEDIFRAASAISTVGAAASNAP